MKCFKSDNKGFTLVELIVVLVILAILAAILIPGLLGYIDEAKKKQDILEAKSLLNAVQSELAKEYSKYSKKTSNNQTTIFNENKYIKSNGSTGTLVPNGNEKNCDISDSKFASDVYKLADCEPYIFAFGVGNFEAYATGTLNYKQGNNDKSKSVDTDIHKAYTVYYAVYMRTKDSTPLFFDGKNWTEVDPKVEQGKTNYKGEYIKNSAADKDNSLRNSIDYNGKTIYLQMYDMTKQLSKRNNKWWYEIYRQYFKYYSDNKINH